MLIAPSILAADFSCLDRELERVRSADIIHVDVMDGHYVGNITIGPCVIRCIKSSLPLDVHLMITDPEKYAEAFIKAGASRLSFHVEACKDKGLVEKIRSFKVSPGIALNPETSVEGIIPFLGLIDFVVVMTVNPGFGGQAFMESALPKIAELRKAIRARHLKVGIEVDGGINPETAAKAARAGADTFVAGSYIFKSSNAEGAIEELRKAVRQL
ncbi:ribulose-phosphate 3-epimerase [Candidatus Woesearchaeota archaeon CG08_land_8_20_14_0_20_47_9]|nr:MAG: ribulose-phosphate 3-epimerase [Candidatus Woesearchaeota archaeon CG1_02_47_18]PIO04006.1 MAG: ribulose-phosphate 3-epimerase [Candidatus Woesearchaeota archaeon CG08_land_8_20_14_0_20_47_9]HII29485.1 ribulose-phosphate 3-epimerase [Candidatus Woesearchaeota archaeon]